MSSIALTHQERIQALRAFGYTEREAAFLCTAALHSGYFLRRQYARFLNTTPGGNIAMLIDKVVANEHAVASTYANNVHVYHLCARPFYAALGEMDNRNRRSRQTLSIKSRLMALDFVLEHGQHAYLATEREKVAYFTHTLQIEHNALPAKYYRSKDQAHVTDRRFVDKNPIFLSAAGTAAAMPPDVGFCFVDAAATTVSGFETYLDQYRALFAALPAFQVVYVSAHPRLFKTAQRSFERLGGESKGKPCSTRSVGIPAQLRAYFEMRDLFETGRRASFDRQKLMRLRDYRERFSGSEHEALFNVWKANGRTLSAASLESQHRIPSQLSGRFVTCLLEQNYDFFGNLTTL